MAQFLDPGRVMMGTFWPDFYRRGMAVEPEPPGSER